MQRIYMDMDNLRDMLFDREQILALVENDEVWQQIPLDQRFELAGSFEFKILMGEPYTEKLLIALQAEAESLVATIH